MTTVLIPATTPSHQVAEPNSGFELSAVLPFGFDPDSEFHLLQALGAVATATKWQLVAADSGGDAAISVLLADAAGDITVVDAPGDNEASALNAALAHCSGQTTWIPISGDTAQASRLADAVHVLRSSDADVVVDDEFGLLAPTQLLRNITLLMPQLHPTRRSLVHALAAELAATGHAVQIARPTADTMLTPLLLSLIDDGAGSSLTMRLLATSPAIEHNPAPGGRDYLASMTAAAEELTSASSAPTGPVSVAPQETGLDASEFGQRALRGMWHEFSGYRRETAPQAQYWAEPLGTATVPTVLPAAQIIVLVSDPRDVWCSQGSGSLRQGSTGFSESTRLAALERFQRSVAELVSRRYPEADRVLLLRREDLRHDLTGQTRRLSSWLGVTLDAAALLADDPTLSASGTAEALPRWRQALPAEEARLFNEELGREMATLGYAAATEAELVELAQTATEHPAPAQKLTVGCPVCHGRELAASITKADVRYWECTTCEALFAQGHDPNVIVTHNNAPGERTDPMLQANRLRRITDQLGRPPRKLLDFGCGLGRYVDYLNSNGYDAVGIDMETELQLADMKTGDVDAINMVEVIEHLMEPKPILRQLIDILEPGGVLYAESSFVDYLGDPAQSKYIDPRIGHCCIHSRRSIAHLAWYLRVELTWLNNNVFVLRKPSSFGH
jgi:hypothetical protein